MRFKTSARIVVLSLSLCLSAGALNLQVALADGTPNEKPFPGGRVLTRPLTDAEKKHKRFSELALSASQSVYKLPNLRSRAKHSDYLTSFSEFSTLTPAGYSIYGADADLKTGLKFVIYKPSAEADPWILSIAGSEGFTDWISNASLGVPQFRQNGKAGGLTKIVSMVTLGFIPNAEILITGHSLGGGLAQAVAHEVQKYREENGQSGRVRMTLITWNAFGAQKLIERVSTYQPALIGSINIFNYFLQGDPVSRIGDHFGPTFELIPPARKPKYEFRPDGPNEDAEYMAHLHALATVTPIVHARSGANLREAKGVRPESAGAINFLTKFSWILNPLNGATFEFRQLWIVRWMTDYLSRVQSQDLDDPIQNQSIRFVYNVAMTELQRMNEENDSDSVVKRDRRSLNYHIDRVYWLFRAR